MTLPQVVDILHQITDKCQTHEEYDKHLNKLIEDIEEDKYYPPLSA